MIPSPRPHTRFSRLGALARALCLLVVFAMGCAEPLSPAEVAGRYALQRVGNELLPVPWPGVSDAPQRPRLSERQQPSL